MRLLVVFMLTLSLTPMKCQTKTDGRFRNMETVNYTGLGKTSIRYRLNNHVNEDWITQLEEKRDTFIVFSTVLFGDDTVRINRHTLTFNNGDTCVRDLCDFMFSLDYEADAYFFVSACCVKWNKTTTPNLYVSKFRYRQTLSLRRSGKNPRLSIEYRYLPDMTEEQYNAFTKGAIIW